MPRLPVADLFNQRRDLLQASGAKRGITVSAPTNDDAAEISLAIRERLKQQGEIDREDVIYKAVDQRGQAYDLAVAAGDRLRLFRRTRGEIDGKRQEVGSNGDVVEVLGLTLSNIRFRTKDGRMAEVEWRRLADEETGRIMLGFGHPLTIDSAQSITSDEHINALPRGTSGVTGFTSYVAESRSKGVTWTVISEGAVFESVRNRQALGDITPITKDDLWARAAKDMSNKPYKALATDLLNAARQDRADAVDSFIVSNHALEFAQLSNPEFGRDAVKRFRAQAVNEGLGRHLTALDHVLDESASALRETHQAREARQHLHKLRTEAVFAKR